MRRRTGGEEGREGPCSARLGSTSPPLDFFSPPLLSLSLSLSLDRFSSLLFDPPFSFLLLPYLRAPLQPSSSFFNNARVREKLLPSILVPSSSSSSSFRLLLSFLVLSFLSSLSDSPRLLVPATEARRGGKEEGGGGEERRRRRRRRRGRLRARPRRPRRRGRRGGAAAVRFVRSFGSVFSIDRSNGTLPHPLRSPRYGSARLRSPSSRSSATRERYLLLVPPCPFLHPSLLFSLPSLGHLESPSLFSSSAPPPPPPPLAPLFSFARSLSPLFFSTRLPSPPPPPILCPYTQAACVRPSLLPSPSSLPSSQPCLPSLLVTDLRKYKPKDQGVHAPRSLLLSILPAPFLLSLISLSFSLHASTTRGRDLRKGNSSISGSRGRKSRKKDAIVPSRKFSFGSIFRPRERECVRVYAYVCVCVCVCARLFSAFHFFPFVPKRSNLEA